MWISHFAAGVALKPLAPNVPLSVLALAGALPDATFFANALLGVEKIRFSESLNQRGCFPYANDYPYSHSLVGMAVLSVVFAGVYKLFLAKDSSRVGAKDLLAIILAGLSHYVLELPVHRPDVVLTPGDKNPKGAGLFDAPTAVFFLELAVTGAFFIPYLLWTAQKPQAASSVFRRNAVNILLAALTFAQFQFCFMGAPTHEARMVHAPLFIGQILGTCWALGWMDSTRFFKPKTIPQRSQ